MAVLDKKYGFDMVWMRDPYGFDMVWIRELPSLPVLTVLQYSQTDPSCLQHNTNTQGF